MARTRAEIEAAMAQQFPEEAPAPSRKRTRAEIEAEMAARFAEPEPAAAAPAPAPATPILDQQLQSFQPKDEAEWRKRGFRDQAARNSFLQNLVAGAADVIPSYVRGAQQGSAENRIEAARQDIMGEHPGGRLGSLGQVQHPNAPERLAASMEDLQRLQQEEAANRERMDPINRTAGGLVGNIATNIAITSPLELAQGARAIGAATKLLKGAPKVASSRTAKELLMASALREGATGYGTGTLTPTVPGESRQNNALTQAAFGVGGAGLGAAAQSKLAQNLAGKVLDVTPLTMNVRTWQRNKAARAAVKAYNEEAKALNAVDKAAYKVAQTTQDNAYRLAVKESNRAADAFNMASEIGAKKRAATAKALHNATVRDIESKADYTNLTNQLREQERLGMAEQALAQHTEQTKQQIGRFAGWGGMPEDQLAAKSALAGVGQKLGQIVEPYEIPVDKFVQHAKDMTRGLDAEDERKLLRIGEDVAAKASVTGRLSGRDYSTTRRELVDALGDARGTTRERIESMLERLDEAFDEVAPKEVVDELRLTRGQYAIGHRVANAPWDPKTGVDLKALNKRMMKLSDKADSQGARRALVNALRNAPDKPVAADLPMARPADIPEMPEMPLTAARATPEEVPVPEPLEAPEMRPMREYTPERSDWGRAGAIQGAGMYLTGGLGTMLAAPIVAGAIKASKNDPTRKTVAALLRSINATYGSNFAAGEKKKPKE